MFTAAEAVDVAQIVGGEHFGVARFRRRRLIIDADAVLALPEIIVAQRGGGPVRRRVRGMPIVVLQRTVQRQGVFDGDFHIDGPGLRAGLQNRRHRTVRRACIQGAQLLLQFRKVRGFANLESREASHDLTPRKIALAANVQLFQLALGHFQPYQAVLHVLLWNIDIDGSVSGGLIGALECIGGLFDGADRAVGSEERVNGALDHGGRQYVIAQHPEFSDVERTLLSRRGVGGKRLSHH